MEKDELTALYKNVFKTEDGKKVLKDILKKCGFGLTKAGDPNLLLRQTGREDISIYILDKVYKDLSEQIDDIQTELNYF